MANKKSKFKINEDTMTTIVVSSLLFCVAVTITGIVFQWFDKDISAIVASTHTVFGAELGICGLIKIFDNYLEKRNKKEDVANG